MIVVTIRGGLGNQMFQYAFGRGASLALGRELILDLSAMPTGRVPYLRAWDLPQLPIAPVRKIGAPRLRYAGPGTRPIVRAMGAVSRKAMQPWVVDEPDNEKALPFSRLPGPVAVCNGYWQSVVYFEEFASDIRRELTPRLDPSARGLSLLRRVEGRETIAVHVRRGDYVGNPRVVTVHAGPNSRYHYEAAQCIAGRLSDPVALVFSDDPEWAANNLNLDVEVIHAEARAPFSPVETLALMARCEHHVIANSSFSWWGAYLASSTHQQVFYPSRWSANRPINDASRFPAHWRPFCAE